MGTRIKVIYLCLKRIRIGQDSMTLSVTFTCTGEAGNDWKGIYVDALNFRYPVYGLPSASVDGMISIHEMT